MLPRTHRILYSWARVSFISRYLPQVFRSAVGRHVAPPREAAGGNRQTRSHRAQALAPDRLRARAQSFQGQRRASNSSNQDMGRRGASIFRAVDDQLTVTLPLGCVRAPKRQRIGGKPMQANDATWTTSGFLSTRGSCPFSSPYRWQWRVSGASHARSVTVAFPVRYRRSPQQLLSWPAGRWPWGCARRGPRRQLRPALNPIATHDIGKGTKGWLSKTERVHRRR